VSLFYHNIMESDIRFLRYMRLTPGIVIELPSIALGGSRFIISACPNSVTFESGGSV
jgi:hypothetical protein